VSRPKFELKALRLLGQNRNDPENEKELTNWIAQRRKRGKK
jgi:hypothetical protein